MTAYLLCNCNSAKTDVLKEERHVNEVSKVRVPAYTRVPVRLMKKISKLELEPVNPKDNFYLHAATSEISRIANG
jgi:hypothetical protein